MSENKDAAIIFQKVRAQTKDRLHIESSMGGMVAYSDPIDLDHVALWKAIEKYPGGIKDEWGTFNKVLRAWHFSQEKKRESEG